MQGEQLPYLLQNDWMITILMVLSFIIMSWSVKNGKTYLVCHLKNFFIHKDRGSLFDKPTSNGSQYLFVQGVVTCILCGVLIYDEQIRNDAILIEHINRGMLLFSYIFSVIGLVILKWLLYTFVNWIFFDKQKNIIWTEAYFDLIILMSFILFPVVLFIIYFDINTEISVLILLLILLISKLLLFYKCIRNFCSHYYGIIHIILYFCALELAPDLMMREWVAFLNSIL